MTAIEDAVQEALRETAKCWLSRVAARRMVDTTRGEIAAFLVPEATMAPRISRAKRRLRGADFEDPPESERPQRLRAVRHVLYLI